MESLINHIEKGIMVANPFGAGEKESKLLEIDNIYRNIYHQMELNNYGESFINSLGHRFYGLLDLSLNFLARDVKIIVIESKKT
jgi:adenylate cyclase